jgi:hypothetical protein
MSKPVTFGFGTKRADRPPLVLTVTGDAEHVRALEAAQPDWTQQKKKSKYRSAQLLVRVAADELPPGTLRRGFNTAGIGNLRSARRGNGITFLSDTVASLVVRDPTPDVPFAITHYDRTDTGVAMAMLLQRPQMDMAAALQVGSYHARCIAGDLLYPNYLPQQLPDLVPVSPKLSGDALKLSFNQATLRGILPADPEAPIIAYSSIEGKGTEAMVSALVLLAGAVAVANADSLTTVTASVTIPE